MIVSRTKRQRRSSVPCYNRSYHAALQLQPPPLSFWLIVVLVAIHHQDSLLFCQASSSSSSSSSSPSTVGTRIDVQVGSNMASAFSMSPPPPQLFPAMVAAFGNQDLASIQVSNLNLMLPPDGDAELCQYPEQAVAAAITLASSIVPNDDYNNSSINNKNRNNSAVVFLSDNDFDGYQNSTTTATTAPSKDDSLFDYNLVSRDNIDVALFVQYGECLPYFKATIAAKLQNEFTRFGRVTHLLIYNNNVEKMDELSVLTTYIDGDEMVADISVVYVSTRTGQDIMAIIEAEEQRQRYANPEMLAEGNELWYLPVSFVKASEPDQPTHYQIDPYDDPFSGGYTYPPQPQMNDRSVQGDDFYWFRLVVFGLLVVSPCFRAAYLWYSGGARIRFRYNEEGRIVGLQYIPPMPYWFAPRPDDSYPEAPSQMTEAQVMALPEIVYGEPLPLALKDHEVEAQPQPQEQSLSQSQRGNKEERHSDNDEVSPTGTSSSLYAGLSLDTDNQTHSTGNGNGRDVVDEENPPQPQTMSVSDNSSSSNNNNNNNNNPCEMHTTCSICIDDFEPGECLRMLPRCRHIFHTDCILPWLVERQGCCPMCKTPVIKPEEEDSGDDGDGEMENENHHRTQEDRTPARPNSSARRTQAEQDSELVESQRAEESPNGEAQNTGAVESNYERIEIGQIRSQ